MLLVSIPLLMAGGALIMITSMTAANTADSAAETKAYYSAEAGAQQLLAVMRGSPVWNDVYEDRDGVLFVRAESATAPG